MANPEKSSRASIKIDGQRVPLSPEGIEKVRAERALSARARRNRDETGPLQGNQRSEREGGAQI